MLSHCPVLLGGISRSLLRISLLLVQFNKLRLVRLIHDTLLQSLQIPVQSHRVVTNQFPLLADRCKVLRSHFLQLPDGLPSLLNRGIVVSYHPVQSLYLGFCLVIFPVQLLLRLKCFTILPRQFLHFLPVAYNGCRQRAHGKDSQANPAFRQCRLHRSKRPCRCSCLQRQCIVGRPQQPHSHHSRIHHDITALHGGTHRRLGIARTYHSQPVSIHGGLEGQQLSSPQRHHRIPRCLSLRSHCRIGTVQCQRTQHHHQLHTILFHPFHQGRQQHNELARPVRHRREHRSQVFSQSHPCLLNLVPQLCHLCLRRVAVDGSLLQCRIGTSHRVGVFFYRVCTRNHRLSHRISLQPESLLHLRHTHLLRTQILQGRLESHHRGTAIISHPLQLQEESLQARTRNLTLDALLRQRLDAAHKLLDGHLRHSCCHTSLCNRSRLSLHTSRTKLRPSSQHIHIPARLRSSRTILIHRQRQALGSRLQLHIRSCRKTHRLHRHSIQILLHCQQLRLIAAHQRISLQNLTRRSLHPQARLVHGRRDGFRLCLQPLYGTIVQSRQCLQVRSR